MSTSFAHFKIGLFYFIFICWRGKLIKRENPYPLAHYSNGYDGCWGWTGCKVRSWALISMSHMESSNPMTWVITLTGNWSQSLQLQSTPGIQLRYSARQHQCHNQHFGRWTKHLPLLIVQNELFPFLLQSQDLFSLPRYSFLWNAWFVNFSPNLFFGFLFH